VLLQYMLTVIVALLLYVSTNEDRWTRFKDPLRQVMVEPDKRMFRVALLVASRCWSGF
jgi:hypothetical protein